MLDWPDFIHKSDPLSNYVAVRWKVDGGKIQVASMFAGTDSVLLDGKSALQWMAAMQSG